MSALFSQPSVSLPNTAACSGSRDLVLWAWPALEQSVGQTPGHGTNCQDSERHREGVRAGCLLFRPLFISRCKQPFTGRVAVQALEPGCLGSKGRSAAC